MKLELRGRADRREFRDADRAAMGTARSLSARPRSASKADTLKLWYGIHSGVDRPLADEGVKPRSLRGLPKCLGFSVS
jgi:hypothetical protein